MLAAKIKCGYIYMDELSLRKGRSLQNIEACEEFACVSIEESAVLITLSQNDRRRSVDYTGACVSTRPLIAVLYILASFILTRDEQFFSREPGKPKHSRFSFFLYLL